jgi:hypothetical protein
VFSKCTAPLDADDWLRTIENNLEVAAVGENKKVILATHFLAAPARAWWDNVKAMQAANHVINWHYKKYVDLRPFIFVTELSQYFIYDDSMTKNGSSKTERQ